MEARNPQYSKADNSTINVELNHPVHGWIPFTADPTDTEAHGREIHAKALAGEYGGIAAYVGPSNEVLAANIRAERDGRLIELDRVVSNPLRWAELTQEQQAAAASYRQALLDVPQQAGFPTQVEWPVYPL
jgi:hypothetical protein